MVNNLNYLISKQFEKKMKLREEARRIILIRKVFLFSNQQNYCIPFRTHNFRAKSGSKIMGSTFQYIKNPFVIVGAVSCAIVLHFVWKSNDKKLYILSFEYYCYYSNLAAKITHFFITKIVPNFGYIFIGIYIQTKIGNSPYLRNFPSNEAFLAASSDYSPYLHNLPSNKALLAASSDYLPSNKALLTASSDYLPSNKALLTASSDYLPYLRYLRKLRSFHNLRKLPSKKALLTASSYYLIYFKQTVFASVAIGGGPPPPPPGGWWRLFTRNPGKIVVVAVTTFVAKTDAGASLLRGATRSFLRFGEEAILMGLTSDELALTKELKSGSPSNAITVYLAKTTRNFDLARSIVTNSKDFLCLNYGSQYVTFLMLRINCEEEKSRISMLYEGKYNLKYFEQLEKWIKDTLAKSELRSKLNSKKFKAAQNSNSLFTVISLDGKVYKLTARQLENLGRELAENIQEPLYNTTQRTLEDLACEYALIKTMESVQDVKESNNRHLVPILSPFTTQRKRLSLLKEEYIVANGRDNLFIDGLKNRIAISLEMDGIYFLCLTPAEQAKILSYKDRVFFKIPNKLSAELIAAEGFLSAIQHMGLKIQVKENYEIPQEENKNFQKNKKGISQLGIVKLDQMAAEICIHRTKKIFRTKDKAIKQMTLEVDRMHNSLKELGYEIDRSIIEDRHEFKQPGGLLEILSSRLTMKEKISKQKQNRQKILQSYRELSPFDQGFQNWPGKRESFKQFFCAAIPINDIPENYSREGPNIFDPIGLYTSPEAFNCISLSFNPYFGLHKFSTFGSLSQKWHSIRVREVMEKDFRILCASLNEKLDLIRLRLDLIRLRKRLVFPTTDYKVVYSRNLPYLLAEPNISKFSIGFSFNYKIWLQKHQEMFKMNLPQLLKQRYKLKYHEGNSSIQTNNLTWNQKMQLIQVEENNISFHFNQRQQDVNSGPLSSITIAPCQNEIALTPISLGLVIIVSMILGAGVSAALPKKKNDNNNVINKQDDNNNVINKQDDNNNVINKQDDNNQ